MKENLRKPRAQGLDKDKNVNLLWQGLCLPSSQLHPQCSKGSSIKILLNY